jgi:membrane-associated protease RseP (regulator of RpoE activity)
MLALLGIVVVVVGLLVSIAWHELGHMWPAKRFGVKVSEYFVGFGPTLWSTRRGETEYGIKAIPLGGYVRLVGMVPPTYAVKSAAVRGWGKTLVADARAASEAEIGEDDARAFYHLSWWRKVIVMAGGPVMNLILAIALFTVVLSGMGVPTQTSTVRDTIACVPAPGANECTPADPTSPAVLAGLQPGDTVLLVDGIEIEGWSHLTGYVSERPGQPILLTIDRDGQVLDLGVTPAARERAGSAGPQSEPIGFLGVYSLVEDQRQPLWSGVEIAGTYTVETAKIVATLPTQLYHVTRAAFGLEDRSQASVMGIVGIGRAAGDVTSTDVEGVTLKDQIAQLLLLLAGLNLALFVFNMIPLVPLDGGHIASALWQAVKNGWARVRNAPRPAPVDVARMMPVAYGVFGILILMSLVLIYADIVAPVRIT